jgi:hypothetical protein
MYLALLFILPPSSRPCPPHLFPPYIPPPPPTPQPTRQPSRTTFLLDRDYDDFYTTRIKELLPPISHFRSSDPTIANYKILSTVLVEETLDSYP